MTEQFAMVSLGAPVFGTLMCVTPSQSTSPGAFYCSDSHLGWGWGGAAAGIKQVEAGDAALLLSTP